MTDLNYRFAVGSIDNVRSSSYTIFTNPNRNDIYVGHRGIVKDLKVSIHESGKNYLGYTSNTNHPIALRETANKGRHLFKWQGLPIHSKGYHLHFRIIFPTCELRNMDQDVNNKIINWVSSAPEGCQLEVAILTGPPTEEYPKTRNAPSLLLTKYPLPNDTMIYILGVTQPYIPKAFQNIKRDRRPNPDERIIGMILRMDPAPGFVDLAGD